jgi:hypothetical protein
MIATIMMATTKASTMAVEVTLRPYALQLPAGTSVGIGLFRA